MRNFDLSLSQLKNFLLVAISFVLIFIFFSRPLSIDNLLGSSAPFQSMINDKADVEKSTRVKKSDDEETTSEVPKTEKSVGAEPKLLENILTAKYQPRQGGKSIFFIETKKIGDKVLALTNRQSCSIEAASRTKFQSIEGSDKRISCFSYSKSRAGRFPAFFLRSRIFQ